ncbi:MAG: sulfotransferase [Sphingomonadales bacterium]
MSLEITQETAETIHKELVKANKLASEGKRGAAKAICLSVYDLCPDYPDTNQILGLIYLQDLEFHKAAEHFARTVKIFPEQPFIWLRLGQSLVEIRQEIKAEQAFQNALKYAPDSAEAHFRLGELKLALGNQIEAKSLFEKAHKLDPKMGQALRLLAKSSDEKEAKTLAEKLREILKNPGDQPPQSLANIAFGLGTCLDQLGNKEWALDLFTNAKLRQAGGNPAWRQNYEENFANSKKVFTREFLKKTVPSSTSKITPIFIVGVPRSGSTLLEQILASHSKVSGSDEVRFSEALFNDLNTLVPHKPYPENVSDLSQQQLIDLSEKYQTSLAKLDPKKTIFTDKMLSNFHVLGLLKILFPNARVINIQRDPLDTASSIIKNIFSISSAPYLASPADIGAYFHQYQDLMAFWHKALPDFILDVSYEDLVQNPESQIKNILKFCGLAFEKSCLEFSKTERAVYSPSSGQVRKPLYATSIGAGEKASEHLAPFSLTSRGIFPLAKSDSIKEQLVEASEKIKDLHLDAAEDICRGLLKADPHQASAMQGLGAIRFERQQLDEAIDWYKKSLTFFPRQPGTWTLLGQLYVSLGQTREAHHALFMALCYKEDNAEALYWLARLELGAGNEEAAGEYLKKAIAVEPDFMAAYDLALRIKGFTPDPVFLEALEKAALKGGRSDLDTIYANYALAHHYKSSDKEKFVGHLERATKKQGEIAADEFDAFSYAAGAAKKSFFPETFFEKTDEKFKKLTPIFIVGLPRTGSSLLEQMLASHKSVAGGDEIPFLNSKLIARLERLAEKPYPEGINALSGKDWGNLATVYQTATERFSGGLPFVTDKMLSNGLFLGIALKAMPWAKAIHIRRNILDTALSIYSHYFIEKLTFAYDFGAMATYLRQMEETMAHWKALCPDNILEVEYETLVKNPEKEMKRILKFLGLPWNPQVLEFYKNDRAIQTLSLAQVNQPIFETGAGAWKEYADLLEPFRSEISDLIDDDGFLKS